ncbi:MAG: DNA-binding protein [Moraxellaceae bacterium]|nr:DNA-binding protein [Moraxellaceae bacterium]
MTSRLMQTLHETAEDFASIGLIDVQTMREFDVLCLPPAKLIVRKKLNPYA